MTLIAADSVAQEDERKMQKGCEMTLEEAIENLKCISEKYQVPWHRESIDMAVEALEKKIPKKPTKSKAVIAGANYAYWCPSCKRCFTLRVSFNGRNKYCDMCGQVIDWSEAE